MAKSKRVPVMVDEEQYEQIKTFTNKTGVPISRVVRDAIKSYMFVQAEAILERRAEIEKEMASKVVSINSAGEVEPIWDGQNVIVPPAS